MSASAARLLARTGLAAGPIGAPVFSGRPRRGPAWTPRRLEPLASGWLAGRGADGRPDAGGSGELPLPARPARRGGWARTRERPSLSPARGFLVTTDEGVLDLLDERRVWAVECGGEIARYAGLPELLAASAVRIRGDAHFDRLSGALAARACIEPALRLIAPAAAATVRDGFAVLAALADGALAGGQLIGAAERIEALELARSALDPDDGHSARAAVNVLSAAALALMPPSFGEIEAGALGLSQVPVLVAGAEAAGATWASRDPGVAELVHARSLERSRAIVLRTLRRGLDEQPAHP